VTAAVIVVGLLLAGCTPAPVASPTAGATVSATAVPEPVPTIDLTGTAGENLAYFDKVNKALIAKGGTLDGRAFIDNLVAAGYPKTSMEVTPDRTSVNLEADNIEFSVRLGTTCLVGEYGNIGYASTAAKVFSTGRCLAGKTRTIDW
jgi:hypothetical protein